jgi:hypothetical protein
MSIERQGDTSVIPLTPLQASLVLYMSINKNGLGMRGDVRSIHHNNVSAENKSNEIDI